MFIFSLHTCYLCFNYPESSLNTTLDSDSEALYIAYYLSLPRSSKALPVSLCASHCTKTLIVHGSLCMCTICYAPKSTLGSLLDSPRGNTRTLNLETSVALNSYELNSTSKQTWTRALPASKSAQLASFSRCGPPTTLHIMYSNVWLLTIQVVTSLDEHLPYLA